MASDLRQSEKYADYMKLIGWKVENFGGVYVYIKKILFGYIIKIQRPLKLPGGEQLLFLINKYKFSEVIVEPSNETDIKTLLGQGFKESKYPFLPSKTVWLDLKKSEDELLSQMHYKTRYNIKHARSGGIKIINSTDIKKFADFWQKTSFAWGMFLPEKKNIKGIFDAFGSDARIFLAEKEGSFLGGILLISTKEISYYMYAAYSDLGKKLFVPTLLTWKAIKYAKKEGKKTFDFEGIYDERFPLKSWQGFSRFKKSFGGRVVDYPRILVISNLPFGITV
jgi:lipid II:glycine glycyltransferase (peptidoglycan interpeptide bridge formation enzyme)